MIEFPANKKEGCAYSRIHNPQPSYGQLLLEMIGDYRLGATTKLLVL